VPVLSSDQHVDGFVTFYHRAPGGRVHAGDCMRRVARRLAHGAPAAHKAARTEHQGRDGSDLLFVAAVHDVLESEATREALVFGRSLQRCERRLAAVDHLR
jgi:hypothetical protein